jgi:hypothetical protein
MKKQKIYIKIYFKLGKTNSKKKNRMMKEAFDDNALNQTQNYEWLKVSRTDKCQSIIKRVLDELLPEARPKMWQNFGVDGIVHKECVRLGQTANKNSITTI